METETIDLWLKVIGSYGFPIASVLALFWLFVHAARAVWSWMMPRIDKVIDAHMTFLTTLTENDTRHTEAMETLSSEGKTGHSTTHNKLDVIGEKVHAIHNKVVN